MQSILKSDIMNGSSCTGAVKPIIIGGILFAVASQIILMGEVMATMDIYMMPEYFPVWSKLMMPDMGPPPTVFYAISISVSVGLALLYSTIFHVLRAGIPGTGIRKGLNYGILMFLLSSLPSMLGMWMLINLPVKFFIAGLAFGLIHYLIGGVVISWAFQKFGSTASAE
jgi:hypothetical protein